MKHPLRATEIGTPDQPGEQPVNKLHLILVAVLDTAKTGGLKPEHAEALFHSLSGYLRDVPSEILVVFEQNVQCILDAKLP
jgi:hypothetical protein